MTKLKITFLASIFLVVILVVAVNYKIDYKKSILIDIPQGTSASSISKLLSDRGLIFNELLFRLYTKLTSIEELYKAGEYQIKDPESIFTLTNKLVKGDFFYRKLTLLPGHTLEDIFKLGESEGLLNDLKLTVKDKYMMNGIELKEGVFYPDTFFYLKGETFSSILSKSSSKWKIKYQKLWKERSSNLPYNNLMEAITLASIIEKEGLEKEQIAGVFINRLNKGMKLQSDPTVIFAMGKEFDGNIKRKDLKLDNPYNTYRYKGLPPGPISLVSEKSLYAALNPLQTDYLYFVSMKNGYHKFSKNLSDHNEAVLEYQINAR